jgi:hypothetical protein
LRLPPHSTPARATEGPIEVLPALGLLSLVWLVGFYALAVGVALIVLALRLRGCEGGRGLQGDLIPRGGTE